VVLASLFYAKFGRVGGCSIFYYLRRLIYLFAPSPPRLGTHSHSHSYTPTHTHTHAHTHTHTHTHTHAHAHAFGCNGGLVACIIALRRPLPSMGRRPPASSSLWGSSPLPRSSTVGGAQARFEPRLVLACSFDTSHQRLPCCPLHLPCMGYTSALGVRVLVAGRAPFLAV
jgi:hypothetical protein